MRRCTALGNVLPSVGDVFLLRLLPETLLLLIRGGFYTLLLIKGAYSYLEVHGTY